MIPTETQATALWGKYALPDRKRHHVRLVADVARFFARRCQTTIPGCVINERLLHAAALLHDIDKAVPKLAGERHPDTAVRILTEEGMEEVAQLVKNHSLHAILSPQTEPRTWEERLLYLADKMVKDDVITVDKRFQLWNEEHLPPEARDMLDRAYPKVKALEEAILTPLDLKPEQIAREIL